MARMMFPLSSGFSTGQAAVVQASMWGIGMAKTVYANAVTAMGPDALVIATPMIPGTKNIVLNLIQDELCRALINQSTNTVSSNPQMVPAPAPTTVTNQYGGATTWAYTPIVRQPNALAGLRNHHRQTTQQHPADGQYQPAPAQPLPSSERSLAG